MNPAAETKLEEFLMPFEGRQQQSVPNVTGSDRAEYVQSLITASNPVINLT